MFNEMPMKLCFIKCSEMEKFHSASLPLLKKNFILIVFYFNFHFKKCSESGRPK